MKFNDSGIMQMYEIRLEGKKLGAFKIVARVANILSCFKLENMLTKVGNPLFRLPQF